jgi:ABC-type transport system involved in multi-copper enzyme maturation permease subunit
VSLFVLPLFVEPLVGQLLTTSQQHYMPFVALSSSVDNGIVANVPGELSALKSGLIVVVYLVVFGSLAWYSFLKRDAN